MWWRRSPSSLYFSWKSWLWQPWCRADECSTFFKLNGDQKVGCRKLIMIPQNIFKVSDLKKLLATTDCRNIFLCLCNVTGLRFNYLRHTNLITNQVCSQQTLLGINVSSLQWHFLKTNTNKSKTFSTKKKKASCPAWEFKKEQEGKWVRGDMYTGLLDADA